MRNQKGIIHLLAATMLLFSAHAQGAQAQAAQAQAAPKPKPQIQCSPYELRVFTAANWCPSCQHVNDGMYLYSKSLKANELVSKCGYEKELIVEAEGQLFAVRINKIDVAYSTREESKEQGMVGKYLPEMQVRFDNALSKSEEDSSIVLDLRTGDWSFDAIRNLVRETTLKHSEKQLKQKAMASRGTEDLRSSAIKKN